MSTRRDRMLRRRGIVVIVALAAVVSAPAAQASSPSPRAKVVLRIGTTTDLVTDNPFAVSANSDWEVVTTQYDMLLKFGDQDLRAAPSLSTGCDPSSDSMTWTCHLRPNLRWSDGTPLTSADVAFTYRFVIEHRIPQYISYFPSHPTFETPDPTTLIWKADAPTFAPSMPPWVYIVPEHVWGKYERADLKTVKDVPNTPSVSSGPFHLVSWQRGREWTLDRNPYFWGPTPNIDEIQFRLYTNQEGLVQALQNGEVDMIDSFEPSLLATLQRAPNVTVQRSVPDWWLNLAFNFGGQGAGADPLPALHDIRLRRAIEMAIDKQAIVDKVYQGTADAGDTIIRPASTYWHLDIPPDQEIAFDPAAANALLDQAGYVDTNSDGTRNDPKTGDELVLRIPASQDTEGAVEAGQLIAGYLKAVGIKVQLQPSTDAKMGDYWATGNFDAYIWYWSGDPDPNYQLSVFTSGQCGGWSDGCWKDPHYDTLYDQQRTTMDQAARLKIVQEMQRYEYDQVPGIVLAYPSNLSAYRSDRFTGWVPAPGANGYLIPGYNYDSFTQVRPASAAAAAGESGSSGLPPWIWLIVLGLLALLGVRMARGKRRRIGNEEAEAEVPGLGTRRYLFRKVLFAGITLLFVLAFNFFLFRVMPGDPVALLTRSERLTPADIAKQRALYGLDRPLPAQFVVYLRETLTGHLGVSLHTGQPVTEAIAGRIWPTLLLVGLGTSLAAVLGIAIGIKGGWRRGSRFDTTTLYGSLIFYAMPEGWLAMLLLIVFAGKLGWFPTGGFETGGMTGFARLGDIANHLFLPCLTLTLAYIGQFSIVMRSSLLEVAPEEFVATARAKGVPEDLIRRRHVVPNALLPTISLIFLSFGFILGGDIIIEAVFSWPGLGLLTYQSINTLDYPMLQAIFLLSAVSVIIANLIADVSYSRLDPRVREA